MTTITINERTKAGKTLLELAKLLAVTNEGVSFDSNRSSKAVSNDLSNKQKAWVTKLKKIKKEVDTGTFQGQSAQSFLDGL